jgi:hypothetical protein
MIAHDQHALDAWLSKTWPSGVIAVGGCDAENQPFCRMLASNSAPQLTEEFWLSLNEAVAQLAAYRCGEGRSVWLFETAVLHVSTRGDGAWAGILAPRELAQSVQSAMQTRLQDFVGMVE